MQKPSRNWRNVNYYSHQTILGGATQIEGRLLQKRLQNTQLIQDKPGQSTTQDLAETSELS